MNAAASNSITVMRCAKHRRATKLITRHPNGSVSIVGYDAGKHFAFAVHPAAGIRELAAILDDASHDPRAFVLRGQPLPEVDRAKCRRLLYAHEDGTAPTFREVPRRWAVIDFDDVPGPYRFDPRDGVLAGIYCRSLLPEPWRRCSFWWGLSSSSGLKPGVRIKLAFWLDRAVLGAEIERHLNDCIDASTLRAVQPIYVARPILVGVADRSAGRTGIEEDINGAVTLPELPALPLPAREQAPPEGRRVAASSEAVAARRLAALCRAVEHAGQGGRHRCLLWAASRAVELDDALARTDIADALITAVRKAGLDDSDADLARQVRNGFKLGIFGTGEAAA